MARAKVADEAPEKVSVWYADDPNDPPAAERAVVLGTGRAALVGAEVLAKRGTHVTMLEGGGKQAWDVAPTFKWRHAAWVQELGITVLRGAAPDGWEESGRLRLRWDPAQKPLEGQERPNALDLDLFVVGETRISRQQLIRDLEYRVDVLQVIGDAVTPGSVSQAVHGAYRATLQL